MVQQIESIESPRHRGARPPLGKGATGVNSDD
jgi:hypothetical protein